MTHTQHMPHAILTGEPVWGGVSAAVCDVAIQIIERAGGGPG